MLVDLRDARQRANVLSIQLHDRLQLLNIAREIANITSEHLNGLGQRLMPLGQPFQAFVNVHSHIVADASPPFPNP